MSIWQYNEERFRQMTQSEIGALYGRTRGTERCDFCGTPLDKLREYSNRESHVISAYTSTFDSRMDKGDFSFASVSVGGKKESMFEDLKKTQPHAELFEEHIRVCPDCGWWITFKETISRGKETTVTTYGGVGALKILDISNVQVPIEEVRQYLTAKYEARFELNPKLFEETVASVFKDLGYDARVTAYSGDDGIDVILDGSKGDTIGVQVKRYRGKIGVSQIRELTGALVIKGHTRGIFVTTSDFQSGAQRTADMSAAQGKPIELMNAAKFYDALHLAERARYERSDDKTAPFATQGFTLLGSRTTGPRRDVVW